ncbi:MAG: hypothetical protein WBA54_06070 [Acidaminobacteraceae bacterium]
MNTKDNIRKLIELSDIKKEYLFDMASFMEKEIKLIQCGPEELSLEVINEKLKMQDMILKLDIEFVNTLDKLKFDEGISSIIELDKNRYPSLYDLKVIVDEICSFEMSIDNLQSKLKNIKIKKIGSAKTIKTTASLNNATIAYKKNKI